MRSRPSGFSESSAGWSGHPGARRTRRHAFDGEVEAAQSVALLGERSQLRLTDIAPSPDVMDAWVGAPELERTTALRQPSVAALTPDEREAMHVSARGVYFVPVSALRRRQLPIVSNFGQLAAADSGEREEQLTKTLSSSDGAYVSFEPTWDPIYRSPMGDVRLQPFAAVSGQLNRVRSADDTTTFTFGQGRVGAGLNLEIGRRESGQSVLFVTSRAVMSVFSPSDHERAFGERRGTRGIVESYALLPLGNGVSLLVESTAGQGARPALRFGLWTAATPNASKLAPKPAGAPASN